LEFSYESMGKVIRRLRKERNLSQDVLSGLADIARSHLSMIENGSIHANIETVWKISEALELKPSELFALIEEEIEK